MKNGGDLLLSIGEFSKICEVSTKRLRYYAEIGLINPDEINPENGYRYYSISQLKKMIFMNRLKSYYFSLEEIKAILELGEDQLKRSFVLPLIVRECKSYAVARLLKLQVYLSTF